MSLSLPSNGTDEWWHVQSDENFTFVYKTKQFEQKYQESILWPLVVLNIFTIYVSMKNKYQEKGLS